MGLFSLFALVLIIAWRITVKQKARLGVPDEPPQLKILSASTPCKEILRVLHSVPGCAVFSDCRCDDQMLKGNQTCCYSLTHCKEPDFGWKVTIERMSGALDKPLLMTIEFIDKKYKKFGYKKFEMRSWS